MKSNNKLFLKNVIGFCVISLLILADQMTKSLAVSRLKGKPSYVIFEGVLEFQYAENRGAAFGIFQNRQIIFVIVSIIVLLGILYLFETAPNTKRMLPLQIVYVLVIAGALGNMIDRVSQNYVVDFIYFKLIDFPNFNVADMCVTVGCALLILLMIFFYKEDEEIFFPKKADKQAVAKEEIGKENEE